MSFRFVSCAPERDSAELFDFASLWQAYVACRRGKQRSASAQRYAVGVFDRLAETALALSQGLWKPSPAHSFVVTRPKAREVLAATFGDRVVHHLLVPWLERQYEPVFIHDVWSNRKGKGIHGAVARLRGFMQAQTGNGARQGYALQLDIANFFNSIDRRLLFGLLRVRLERDAARAAEEPRHLPAALLYPLLWLCRRLLTGNAAQGASLLGDPGIFQRLPAHKRLINAPEGKGLPIGNLTSQFFANVYLSELDQFIKHTLGCRYYLRYVDDFVLLANSRRQLEAWRDASSQFLDARLSLRLRDPGRLVAITEGLDFLGYVVRPSHLLVRRRVVGHFRDTLHVWHGLHVRHGRGVTVFNLTPDARDRLQASVASYAAHSKHAASHRLWQVLRQRFAALDLLFDFSKDEPMSFRPNWAAPQEMGLAAQWRYFQRQCVRWLGLPDDWRTSPKRPWLLLMQVGNAVEAYGHSALAIAQNQPRHGGAPIRRKGVGSGLTWPLRWLGELQAQATRHGLGVAWVNEHGYQKSGGKRRVLRRLVLPNPCFANLTNPLPTQETNP